VSQQKCLPKFAAEKFWRLFIALAIDPSLITLLSRYSVGKRLYLEATLGRIDQRAKKFPTVERHVAQNNFGSMANSSIRDATKEEE
jgi:hypothetical protein